MNIAAFPPRIMRRFVETLAEEIGQETLSAVLSNTGLPEEWAAPMYFSGLDDGHAAQTYSHLQSVLRTYYGRGARGILLRIGAKLWNHLLDDAPLTIKTQAALVRRLPKPMRYKPTLELLARILNPISGSITVHTLDLDLLFVDRTSSATLNQSNDVPICFVTLGLIHECLFWADGQEHDVEEHACRASGAHQCEFKITIGG
jgi:predicted hydrocarbon binding protein